jgi:hypothetical protein
MEAAYEDQKYKDQYNGKFAEVGGELKWILVRDELKGRNVKDKSEFIWLCYNLVVTPASFLATGKTKNGDGDGKGIEAALIAKMPRKGKEDNDGTTREHFKDANLALAQRIGLFAIEHYGDSLPSIKGWIHKFGGKPSQLTLEKIKAAYGSKCGPFVAKTRNADGSFSEVKFPNGATVDILWLKIYNFQKDRVYWSDAELAKLMPPVK